MLSRPSPECQSPDTPPPRCEQATREIEVCTYREDDPQDLSPHGRFVDFNPHRTTLKVYGTPRSEALFEALGTDPGDATYTLAATPDGRWGAFSEPKPGNKYAVETTETENEGSIQ